LFEMTSAASHDIDEYYFSTTRKCANIFVRSTGGIE
jgi:hypothetical protein